MTASSKIITPDDDSGFNWMIKKCFGGDGSISVTTEDIPDKFSVGKSIVAVTDTDAGVLSKIPFDVTAIDACDATTGWTIDGAGTTIALNTTDELVGTGCINLVINDITDVVSFYKTVTSVDLSATGTGMHMFMYITDFSYMDTDTVTITLGTGGFTNDNVYVIPFAKLVQDGWFSIDLLDLSDYDSQDGTGATLSDIDSIKLSFVTALDTTGNNIMMDQWSYALAADYKKDFEATYPTTNSTNFSIVFQSKITTTEANGFNIAESVIQNDDDMPLSRSNFTVFQKSSDKEIRITNTIRFSNKV